MAQQSSSSPKWYSNSIFDKFWKHYNESNRWLTENGHQVIQFNDDFEDLDNSYKQNNDNLLYEKNVCEDKDRNNSHLMNRGFVNKSKMDSLEEINENECNSYNNEEFIDSDESDVLDINEDYLKFVMETKRHQLERKRLREKKLRYNDRVEYVDISKIDSFVTKSLAPKKNTQQDLNETKNQQMYELYGEDYNIIQGMEAALQLNFDRLCDSYQPKFWPIMPIRM